MSDEDDNVLVGFLSNSIWPNSFEPNNFTPVAFARLRAATHSSADFISIEISLDKRRFFLRLSEAESPEKTFAFSFFTLIESEYFLPIFRSSYACLIFLNCSSLPPLSE